MEAQQIVHASRYHSFKFVLFNYIPEGKAISKPNLSRIKLIVTDYLKDRQYEIDTDTETGLSSSSKLNLLTQPLDLVFSQDEGT